MLPLLVALSLAAAPASPPLPVNRAWDVLSPADDPATWRDAFRQAGKKLGTWTIDVAGTPIDGAALTALADASPDEPFLRVIRERLGRPVDLPDFLYLLDDVIRSAPRRRGERYNLSAGRLRAIGAFVHPDDVFDPGHPRRYPDKPELAVDTPLPKETLEPAADGDALGPRWAARYVDPVTETDLMAALAAASTTGFADRLGSLLAQLRDQGAEVYVNSTVRHRERGYLMWGAWLLSKQETARGVRRTVKRLDDANEDWELHVPITWSSPDGWRATREAARQMAETYDVVYATEAGARESRHYDGIAADVVVLRLPRQLWLVAPDGARAWFSLLDPSEPRDLSLTPRVIAWIDEHFGFAKLEDDYPHWNDALAPR